MQGIAIHGTEMDYVWACFQEHSGYLNQHICLESDLFSLLEKLFSLKSFCIAQILTYWFKALIKEKCTVYQPHQIRHYKRHCEEYEDERQSWQISDDQEETITAQINRMRGRKEQCCHLTLAQC